MAKRRQFPLGEAEESASTEGDRTQLDKDKVLREGMQEAQLKSVPTTPLSIISQLFFLFWQFMKFFPPTHKSSFVPHKPSGKQTDSNCFLLLLQGEAKVSPGVLLQEMQRDTNSHMISIPSID